MARESLLTEVTFELRMLDKEPGMGIFWEETTSVKCPWGEISLSYSRAGRPVWLEPHEKGPPVTEVLQVGFDQKSRNTTNYKDKLFVMGFGLVQLWEVVKGFMEGCCFYT